MMRDTLDRWASPPDQQDGHSMEHDEGTASPEDRGWWIAAIFVILTLVVAMLFVVYVLLWNGGAHT
jgi:hypothetical protein